MDQYYCKVCGQLDAKGITGHRCASNSASNKDHGASKRRSGQVLFSESEEAAEGIEDVADTERGLPICSRVADGKVPEAKAGSEGNSKQRWSREKYNAYQREYMRKKRALRPDTPN